MSLRVSKPGFNIREKLNELDRPIGVQGNNILRSKTASESFEIIQAGRRNMAINGDMMIAQRGTYIDSNTPSRTTGITADTFGACDRWELDISSAGTWTQEQVKDAPLGSGFMFSSKITCTTADTGGGGNTPTGLVSIRQKIEHGLEMSLQHNSNKAKPLTVSFWVKSNEPGKYYLRMISINSTASMQISRGYNIEQSGVWEFKTLTFPPDTVNYPVGGITANDSRTPIQGMEIYFCVGANSNTYGSAHYGTWNNNSAFLHKGQTNLAAATGNYFQLTGVQIEKGPQNTPFEHLHYTENLALCQRYCLVYGNPSEARHLGCASAYDNYRINVSLHFPVSMRTKPSVTPVTVPSGGNAGKWLQSYVGANGSITNATISVSDHGTDHNSIRLFLTSAHSGLTAGQALWIHTIPNAKLVLDAEL